MPVSCLPSQPFVGHHIPRKVIGLRTEVQKLEQVPQRADATWQAAPILAKEEGLGCRPGTLKVYNATLTMRGFSLPRASVPGAQDWLERHSKPHKNGGTKGGHRKPKKGNR